MAFCLQHISFISRSDAQHHEGNPNAAIISIYDTEDGPVFLSQNWGGILKLIFHDVNPDDCQGNEILFSGKHANDVINFMDDLPENINEIVVHCFRGISRSAAVAKAISDAYKLDFPGDYCRYNAHVYRVLADYLGVS